ncbi:hypothetical protein [Vibrio phage vB_VhaS-a]|nr:hypothetical protein [Vibrio phage vB_VhaS-a]
MNVDKIVVATKLPFYFDENVNSMHLPSSTNKQVVLPVGETSGKLCTEIAPVNLDSFFRNLKGLVNTGYEDAPNLDLILDIVDLWHSHAENCETLSGVNMALLRVLKSFGLIKGEIVLDTDHVDPELCDIVTYTDQLTTLVMGDIYVSKVHTRSQFSSYLIGNARDSLDRMVYQRVDLDNKLIDELTANIDPTNTSFLEVLAWVDYEQRLDAFKLRTYHE